VPKGTTCPSLRVDAVIATSEHLESTIQDRTWLDRCPQMTELPCYPGVR
jgi:hypothetical protein